MKTTFSLLCAFATFITASTALYLEERGLPNVIQMSSRQLGTTASKLAGAIYFITNEPGGNYVVAAAVDNNGKVTFSRALSAFGRGAHGVDAGAVGPDPFFSQGAVAVSKTSNILATVNAGSNTLSIFSIDPKNPVNIKHIGSPVSSEGEFPMSVALDKTGSRLCVLNGGRIAGVNCYSVDHDLGLIPLNNTLRYLQLNQTTPPSGPPGSASHILFNEDNTKLVASIKGVAPKLGYLAVWEIAQDGSLSESFTSIQAPTGGMNPFGMTVIPGQNAFLVADPAVGFDIVDFSATNAANSSPSKNSAIAVPGQGAVCWSAFSNKTGNYYVIDAGTNIVSEISIDKNLNSTLVKQYPPQANGAIIDADVAKIGSNDFLFVLAPNITSVEVLALNGPGQAKIVGAYDFSKAAKSSGLTINSVNVQGMAAYSRG